MAGPRRFRRKPVVIEAMRWMGPRSKMGNTVEEIAAWGCVTLPTRFWNVDGHPDQYDILIDTLSGTHRVRVGDWIVRGVKGEFYPCNPESFDITYEPA